MLDGCCMLRYTSFVVCALLLLTATFPQASASSFANVNMYGFPMTMGVGGTGAAGIPGESYTYTNDGLDVSDVMSRYGIISSSISSGADPTSVNGFVSPYYNGISLGVNFGYPTASHDAATAAFAKDMAYEADLDNAFIAFPGIGVGSMGLSSPTVSSNRASIKYAESIKFQLTTESDTLDLGGFYSPLGLGLGYGSVGVFGSTSMANGGLGMPFYFGTA
ncbi:hypothetical protein [Methanocella arvoryzae]|nr:hypothetical protein [Methanocella arvoryzae]